MTTSTKRFLSFFLIFAMFTALLIPSLSVNSDAASISTTTRTIAKKEHFTLKVTGTTKTIKWSSSNKEVATVTSSGKVTGVKTGTATITAKYGTKKLKCLVTVKGNYKTLYKNFLTKGTYKYVSYGQTTTHNIKYFALKDLDSNGVPDLIVADNIGMPKGYGQLSVYTVKNGKIYYSGSFLSLGNNFGYKSSQKTIIGFDSSPMYGAYYVYKMKKYKLNQVKYLYESHYTNERKLGTTFANASAVSLSTYNTSYNKLVKGNSSITLVANSTSNRNSRLG